MTLRDTQGVTAEIRHLYRARRFSLTSGVGHFQSERKRDETLEFVLPEPLPSFTESSQFTDNPAQTNAYVYSLVDLPKHVTLTMGASADFYRREFLRRNQFNPKLGIVWQPLFSTTVRASAVRTLNRTVVSSQTIEPTQVAGFSQLFADGEAEEARQYGVACGPQVQRRALRRSGVHTTESVPARGVRRRIRPHRAMVSSNRPVLALLPLLGP